MSEKKMKRLNQFKNQLHEGIAYYKQLFVNSANETSNIISEAYNELIVSENKLNCISI